MSSTTYNSTTVTIITIVIVTTYKLDCQTVSRPHDLLLKTLEFDKKKSNIQYKQHTFVYGNICKGGGRRGMLTSMEEGGEEKANI